MKQHEAVILALDKVGGIATLGMLNQEVLKIDKCNWNTKTPFASIRRIVQLHKEIYKIKPGLYGLLKFKKEHENQGIIAENEKNKNSQEVIEFNHSYYQGLIVMIGNMRGLLTHIPNQDKNKLFLNQRLDELRSLKILPSFSYENLVKRSATIDVIWFNQRKMPHSFFEVEHSTDIQNSLLKFNDLQDFRSRMIIVASASRKKEYEEKVKYSAFKDIGDKVLFLDYESLSKQYENQLQKQSIANLI